MMKKYGFTTAETLVTLGIIGFIAAIMLPAIHQAQPNKEMVLLRKAYYQTARIVSELINDEDFYPERENREESGFSNTSIADQIGHEATYHGRTYGGTGTDYPGNQKFCGLFAARLNLKESPNCSQRKSLADGGNFETTDGIVWSMPVSNFSSGDEEILVDVSGGKGNNCYPYSGSSCKAPDRFKFKVDRFAKITIDSPVTREYLSTNNVSKTYDQIVEILAKKSKK